MSWIPFLLMAILAAALSSGVMRDLPVAVVNEDGGAISRELTHRLDASAGLNVVAHTADMIAAETLVRARTVYAVVLIPRTTQRTVLRGEGAPVIVYHNASYSTASTAVVREVSVVVQAQAARLAADQVAAIAPGTVRAPPIAVQTVTLFNPQTSYELQLLALLHPALLHLVFMVAVVSALGRELRDGSITPWLGDRPRHTAIPAIAGKVAVYLVIFTGWAVLVTGYLAGLRSWPIIGSPLMLLVGYAAMYLAYVGVSLLVIGLTLSMSRALSVAGLYAGASFAFAGAIFPIESASGFARLWSELLPYTAFTKLLSEQWVMGAPIAVSLPHILIMLVFFAVGIAIGLPRYIAASCRPDTWGRR